MNTSRITTRDLQQKLLGLGLYKGIVDGIYGSNTVTAVKELQTILTEYNLYNFAIDGKFGTRTYEGMLSYIDIIIKHNQFTHLGIHTCSHQFTCNCNNGILTFLINKIFQLSLSNIIVSGNTHNITIILDIKILILID